MTFQAVVPTLGESPWLERCLAALAGEGIEPVLVAQGPAVIPPAFGGRVIELPENLGFAAATNRGLEAATGELVATVNDDAILEPGWAAALTAALAADPRAAAAQGVNLQLADRHRVDGRGIAFNRSWQAVQIGRGEPAPDPSAPATEVFGVSATAAVYRRRALAEVALGNGVFDPGLGSYYEDVDLACRLRAAGWKALSVPAAQALHAGSATGSRRGVRRTAWIYGNRWLVLARLLGSAFWRRLPGLAGRDLADLARVLAAADPATAAGIPAGWLRAVARLPRFARRGAPALSPAELATGGDER